LRLKLSQSLNLPSGDRMLYSLDRPSARVIGRVVDFDDDDYDYDDDATIELELNEAAIQALTEAAAVALAAFEERPEPRLTPAVRQVSEPVQHGAAVARQPGEALEQEAPAARQASEAFEQKAPAPRLAGEALKQETLSGNRGTASAARAPRKGRRFALGFGMAAVVAGLLGGLTYLATARAPHPVPMVADSGSRPTVAREAPTPAPASARTSVPASAPTSEPAAPATPDVPVRFKNPFDASEVFEFPAGTSRAEMRDAVAELLSQRALERQSLFVKRPRRNTKTPDRDASVTVSGVTPRS
jgi:hypothetical protein